MIEIEVEAPDWRAALPEVEAVVRRAAETALQGEAGELTVLLADDAAVRELNARFRDRDRPTNVLSFPAAATAAPHLGDIVLAWGVCAAEAQAQGKRLDQHLAHLVVHGVLHLRGWDHEDPDEAEAMEALERTLLAKLGVPDPYASQNGT